MDSIRDLTARTAVKNQLSIVEIEETYTIQDCLDITKTSDKLMLEEKLLDEKIVANHKLEKNDREKFIKLLRKEINRLSIVKPVQEQQGSDNYAEFGKALNKMKGVK